MAENLSLEECNENEVSGRKRCDESDVSGREVYDESEDSGRKRYDESEVSGRKRYNESEVSGRQRETKTFEQCDPCLIHNKHSRAQKFCSECEENLCEDCVTNHLKRKATSSHTPVAINDKISVVECYCDPCKNDDKVSTATMFCKTCEEYLCSECMYSHKIRKATRLHEPIAVESLTQINELCIACNNSASYYCEQCEEYLCKPCVESHALRKATKTHTPVTISLLDVSKSEKIRDQRKLDKMCEPCNLLKRHVVATSFCTQCEEFICAECAFQHENRKPTRLHILQRLENVKNMQVECAVCKNKIKETIMYCNICEDALCETCAKRHKLDKVFQKHSIELLTCEILSKKRTCNPCKRNYDIKKAEKMCKQCEDYLCESCTRHHKAQQNTKAHELVSPETELSVLVTLCEPCTENGKQIKATRYCIQCEENLCEDCERKHKSLKIAKEHKSVHINNAPNGSRESCGQCKENGKLVNAIKYCSDCKEFLCTECCKVHSRYKMFKTHSLLEPDPIVHIDIMNCDLCNTRGTAEHQCKEHEKSFGATCGKQQRSFKTSSDHQLSYSIDQRQGRANYISSGSRSPEKRTEKRRHEKEDRPGKPRFLEVFADSLTLSWDPPFKFGENDYYQISYKHLDQDEKWVFFEGRFKSPTAIFNCLKQRKTFVFRVRVVYEDGEGPYSEESDKLLTPDSLASRIVAFSQIVKTGNPSPSIYVLPLVETRAARNEKAKTRKFEFGSSPLVEGKSRTIMLVGATGTGKSTLVDGIVNYVLGVNWDDPFRFTVLDLKEKERKNSKKLQDCSQTEWITCYTINPEIGSRLKYQLNIIDTPGFGDERGLKRDQEIVEQIHHLFSETQLEGVTSIDAVCFTIKALDARLTAAQIYVFQSMMSFFGKDIENNICSLITFADGMDPPVLSALKATGLPFGQNFTFNNSGLFAINADIRAASLSPIFWDMGFRSFRAFFDHLGLAEIQSLQMTKNVLDERSRLEATIRNLQPQLDAGLSKVDCLKQEITIIKQIKSVIKDNKVFEYKVEETQQKQKEKTYAEMQKKYKEATGKLLTHEQIVEKLGEELAALIDEIEYMMAVIESSNKRLKEISLRPNPLTMTEHIDLMIEKEKYEKKHGYLQRINILNEFRKRAQISTESEQFKHEASATLGSVGKKKPATQNPSLKGTRLG